MTENQAIKIWKAHHNQVQNRASVKAVENPSEKLARIAKAKTDYVFFCQYYFAHLCSNENGELIANAPFHNKAAEYILKYPSTRALFEWARGHAKSTHMTVLIPLWLKINNQFKTMLLVSNSKEAAIRLISDLQTELEYNDRYINDFGKQVTHGDWAEDEFKTEDGCAFFCLGKGQSPRGLKNKSARPDYIVVDDIDDDKTVLNEALMDELYRWLLKALFNTMDGNKGRFIVVGNNIGKHSIVAKIGNAKKFHHTTVNAIDANGYPAWKAKYTIDEFDEIRNIIGEAAWQQEFMNNPVSIGAIFKNINYTTVLPYNQYKCLVVYTDPSFKNSDKSDYKATVLVGQTTKGHYHIIKAYILKETVSKMVNWHYEIFKEVKAPTLFYMEANYIQDMLLEEFHKEGNARGLHLPIKGDVRKKPDKFQRIEALEPYFANEKLFFNKAEEDNQSMQTLVSQFQLFQRGARIHDDGPDAVEGAIFIINQRTHQAQPTMYNKYRPANKHNY